MVRLLTATRDKLIKGGGDGGITNCNEIIDTECYERKFLYLLIYL